MIPIIITIIIVLLIVILARRQETLIPPWDLQLCQQKCQAGGQEIPWDGGRGVWLDPATSPASTFDVGDCLARCDLATWS